MSYKLGKLPRKLDRRTLFLENYLDFPNLPSLPDKVDWFAKAGKFSMAGNNTYGDCVVAGAAHMVQTWTANAGRHADLISDQKVIQTYLSLTGGNDIGLNMLEFLKWWKSTGIAGHKIGAFMAVNPKNEKAMKYGNFLFGGVYCGFNLPISAQDKPVWSVPPTGAVGNGAPGSWGGHCVPIGCADSQSYKVSTWGMVEPVNLDFPPIYCDEAYIIVTLEWFTAAHKTPQGIAWKDLILDLGKISRLP